MSRKKRSRKGIDELRRSRIRRVPAPVVRQVDGLLERDARAAHHRHRHLGQRVQQLPSPDAGAGRSRQARRAWRRAACRWNFPTISLGEVFLSPTSLVFRNLMAMDVEEMIRAQPMSAVVLIGGCDKTVPAQLMGAISAGRARDSARRGTDDDRALSRRAARRVHRLPPLLGPLPRRRGEPSRRSTDVEDNLAVTAGTCAVMGTASTMACLSEALGMSLPGSAAVPAVHADRLRIAEATGVRGGAAGGVGPHAGSDRHARVDRERAAGAAGDRRLDQCRHPSRRHRRPRRPVRSTCIT